MGLITTRGQVGEMFKFSQITTIFVVLSAIAGALSWIFYFRALQIGEASQVAPIDKLSIIFTLILSVLFIGEKFTWLKFAGTVLMVVGALMVAR